MKTIKPCRSKWKGTLSDRERFNNQMHCKLFDRTFNMEMGVHKGACGQWPIIVENNIISDDEAVALFGFDLIACVSGDTWTNQPIAGKTVEEAGEKKAVFTPDDWKRYKDEKLRRDDPARKVDVNRIMEQHPSTRNYPLGIHYGSMIGNIRDMLTREGLTGACNSHPDMVEDMVETACVLAEDFLDQVLPRMSFDFASGWENICFKNGPIVSLDFFSDVVVPRYQRIGKRLKAAGIDIWYADCEGDIRPLLPGFMKAGINCLFPYETSSCGHPSKLLDEYGPDLKIMGGFDTTALIGGKESVESHMESLVPLIARGGYIPFCDRRCPPDVTQETYLYYLNLKEQMFGMKS